MKQNKLNRTEIMGANLYRVEINRVMYVLAYDQESAEKMALDSRNNPAECTTKVILATKKSLSKDSDWKTCEPWGIRADMTCKELMEELETEE